MWSSNLDVELVRVFRYGSEPEYSCTTNIVGFIRFGPDYLYFFMILKTVSCLYVQDCFNVANYDNHSSA